MAKQGGKFGRKQEEAIVALLAQPGIDAAARAIGVATRTLLRWHRNAEFRAKYLQARRDVHSQATARLQQATTAAATTMLKLMVDQNVPASGVRSCLRSIDQSDRAGRRRGPGCRTGEGRGTGEGIYRLLMRVILKGILKVKQGNTKTHRK
jgi:transposase-like protein